MLVRIPSLQSFRRSDSRAANPSAQGLTLRGLGGNASSRTLVLLDGIPIADPFFGYVPLSAIDPHQLSSIAAMRGAGGGAFGSAVAGTIALETNLPLSRPPWTARLAGSSDAATDVGLGVTQGIGETFVSLDARWDRGRGFWTTPEDQRVSASARAAYDARSIDGRVVASVGGGSLDGRLRAFADDRTLRFDGADSGMRGLDASLRYVGDDKGWTIAGWHQRRDFSTVVVSATSFRPVLDQYATPARSSGVMVQARVAEGLAMGADVRIARGTAKERALSAGTVTADRANGGRTREAALFAEAEARRGPLTLAGSARVAAWSIDRLFSREEDGDGAVRFDRAFADRSGTALSGRATLLVESGRWNGRIAAYRGVRLPTLNELTRGFTVFPVTTRANSALKPERMTGAEAALTFVPTRDAKIGVTLFANRLADAIGNVTIGPNLRERQNIDAILSRGVEIDAGWRRGAWAIDAALSAVRARIDQPGPLDGLAPAQVPARNANLTVSREAGPMRLSATLRHQSRAFEDDLNFDRLPAATTVDAVARYRVGKAVELSLRGENLFDAKVVTRNQGGSVDLGAPRSIWLGLTWGLTPAPSPR